MKYLRMVLLGATCLWVGMAIQAGRQPPPPVYIQKSDAPRCDLIDRFNKRKGTHL